jgi:hypothetical protein
MVELRTAIEMVGRGTAATSISGGSPLDIPRPDHCLTALGSG